MVLLYTLLVAVLALLSWLTTRRAARLERRYFQAATAAEALLRELSLKPGNNRVDTARTARLHYELGALVSKRDRLEARRYSWQRRADRLQRTVARWRDCKGRLAPYLFGVVDVGLALTLAESLGYGETVQTRHLVQTIVTMLGR